MVKPSIVVAVLVLALGSAVPRLAAAQDGAGADRQQKVDVGAGTTSGTTTGSSGPQDDGQEPGDTAGRASGDVDGEGTQQTETPPEDAVTPQGGFRCDVIQDPAIRAACETQASRGGKER